MTEQKPMCVIVIGAASAAGLAISALEAARAIEVVPLVVDPEPTLKSLNLPEIKEWPPQKPWSGYTGKQKAQWKQETYGRKRK